MNQDIIRQIENEQLKTDRPDFRVGDTIRVYARIKEGTRERIQMFEGTVLKRQNGGLRETFTVRRMSYGVGLERQKRRYRRRLAAAFSGDRQDRGGSQGFCS